MGYPTVGELSQRRQRLEKRAALADSLRRFFISERFLEVTTPSLIAAPAQEEYIETIAAGGGFLRPSPELEMKIMLAAGFERIFQFGPCWRVDESGPKHRREFTMLEYYAAGFDYGDLRDFTVRMLARAALDVNGSAIFAYRGEPVDFSPEKAEILTVADAFERYAGCRVEDAAANGRFDELMVMKIEPQLGRGHLTFLSDYPADRAALARKKSSNPRVSERWELYISGVELANAFSELTDAAEQRRRFAEAAGVRAANGLQPYPEAEDFFAALESGLPESSGSAIGFDRLTMIFCDAPDIQSVGF